MSGSFSMEDANKSDDTDCSVSDKPAALHDNNENDACTDPDDIWASDLPQEFEAWRSWSAALERVPDFVSVFGRVRQWAPHPGHFDWDDEGDADGDLIIRKMTEFEQRFEAWQAWLAALRRFPGFAFDLGTFRQYAHHRNYEQGDLDDFLDVFDPTVDRTEEFSHWYVQLTEFMRQKKLINLRHFGRDDPPRRDPHILVEAWTAWSSAVARFPGYTFDLTIFDAYAGHENYRDGMLESFVDVFGASGDRGDVGNRRDNWREQLDKFMEREIGFVLGTQASAEAPATTRDPHPHSHHRVGELSSDTTDLSVFAMQLDDNAEQRKHDSPATSIQLTEESAKRPSTDDHETQPTEIIPLQTANNNPSELRPEEAQYPSQPFDTYGFRFSDQQSLLHRRRQPILSPSPTSSMDNNPSPPSSHVIMEPYSPPESPRSRIHANPPVNEYSFRGPLIHLHDADRTAAHVFTGAPARRLREELAEAMDGDIVEDGLRWASRRNIPERTPASVWFQRPVREAGRGRSRSEPKRVRWADEESGGHEA